ncbi:glycerophosphodiester phosphodiesterase family protein [Tessaracoccus antarcticus]|uniref:GP-PDE domain-containing protein n=1 Tax=Tessaracoccus antarcticus TaxID=2479848 RepID=A0A3M0G9S8_9ACTN|nr:glycerophosphodiester phosphodiesterase family protein [Tessaracoccus antarcticus]RMB61680.1 hypothetical protein EAX62_03355 [Tessaracoccus antarcticus]
MFGQARFADTNALLSERAHKVGTLIVVHRGTSAGSVVENTPEAVRAALASGGDVIEIDAVASRDGEFFAFHDGEEARLLGEATNLRLCTAAEIRERRYIHNDRPGRPAHIVGLVELLDGVPAGTLVNVDRSWRWWERLLPALDTLRMSNQLLLKCSASHVERINVLRAHPVKYPFIAICSTEEQAHRHLEDPELNTVGVELLAATPESPFLDPAVLSRLRARDALIMVNAEVLATATDLFAGHDDERAVLHSPAEGWGPLFDLGVDAIQTDWPWLLRDYRNSLRDVGVPA